MFTIPVPSAATAAETVTQTSRCVCATVVTTPVGINSANYNGRNRTTSQCWFAHSCAQCRLYLFLLFTQFRYTLFCFFCSFFWRFVHTAFHIRGIQWIRLISFSCNQSFLRSSCFNCARWRRHLLNWIANQVSGDFMCVLFSVCFVYINIYICLTVEQGAVENRQESTNINERQFARSQQFYAIKNEPARHQTCVCIFDVVSIHPWALIIPIVSDTFVFFRHCILKLDALSYASSMNEQKSK